MTMKSIRKDLFECLNTHGQQTMDELENRLPGYSRSQISNNLNAARTEDLVVRDRDDVTNLPAYKLTPAGKNRLADILAKSGTKLLPEVKAEPAKGIALDDNVPVIRKSRTTELAEPVSGEIAELRAQLALASKQRDEHFAEADLLKNALEATDQRLGLIGTMLINIDGEGIEEKLGNVLHEHAHCAQNIADMQDDIRRQTQRATAAEANRDDVKKMLDEVAESTSADMRLIEELKSQIDTKDRIIEAMSDEATQSKEVKEAAIGYLIRVPGKRSLIRSKPEGAHAAAMSSARAHGRADVLALVPVGKAVRVAEWRDA